MIALRSTPDEANFMTKPLLAMMASICNIPPVLPHFVKQFARVLYTTRGFPHGLAKLCQDFFLLPMIIDVYVGSDDST